jgi:hypothetical protein
MNRKRKLYLSISSCMAVCATLFLAGCDRSTSPAGVEAPPAAAASIEDVPAAADPAPTGPSVLTELDDAARSTATTASGLCSFDKIDGQRVSANSTTVVGDPVAFVVSGWVGDKSTMTRPVANLRITQADGTRDWEIMAGPPRGRGDVARHFDNEGLKDAGFEVAVDLSALPPGDYGLSVIHENGGRRFLCDKGARIRIAG